MQNYKTDPNDHQAFTKIRMNNTTFMPVHHTKHHIHHGFWVDIFPLVSIPKSEKFLNLKLKILQASNYCQISDFIMANYDEFYEMLGPKLFRAVMIFNKLPLFFRKFIHTLLISFVFSKPKKNHRLAYVLTSLEFVHNNSFCELIDYKFEDDTFKIPKLYDEYLTTMYGDYMQLPPEDQRGGHGNFIVDENTDYTEYIEKVNIVILGGKNGKYKKKHIVKSRTCNYY